MKKTTFSFITLSLVLSFLIWCSQNTIDTQTNEIDQKNPTVTLIQQRFASPNYAGDYVAQDITDAIYWVDLVVTPWWFDVNPVQLVVAGSYDIWIAWVDTIANANERGADLVIIWTPSYKNPTCFVTKESKNIKTPEDFKGKIVWTLEWTSSHLVYQELMKKAWVARSDVQEVSAPFELTSFIVADAYDVRPAFCNDETVQLELQNIPFTIIEPADYGVDIPWIMYFAKRERVEKNPELVQKTINALASWRERVIADIQVWIDATLKRDDKLDIARAKRLLEIGVQKYFKGENDVTLLISPERIQKTLAIMQSYDLIQTIPNDMVDMRFVEAYHATNNK